MTDRIMLKVECSNCHQPWTDGHECEICDYTAGHFFCILPKGHEEEHLGYKDEECESDSREPCRCFTTEQPGYPTYPPVHLPKLGGGTPAHASRRRVRSVREVAREHGIPEPAPDANQAYIDWLTRKPMVEEE
jgi:hypothetical protein